MIISGLSMLLQISSFHFFYSWVIFHWVWVCVCVCVCVYVSHIFIHSFLNGLLCYFHVLAIVNYCYYEYQSAYLFKLDFSSFPDICPYKWYHIIFVSLWLVSLSIIFSRSILVATNGIISFFLWLSDIPLCGFIYIYSTS